MIEPRKMSAKQQRFVEEYVVDLNGTQAAIRAGYSPHTAGVIASENLTKPLIIDAILVHQKRKAEQASVDAQWVLKRLEESVAEHWKSAPGVAVKSLELLGRHLNMFVDRKELTGAGGTPLSPVQLVIEFSDETETTQGKISS